MARRAAPGRPPRAARPARSTAGAAARSADALIKYGSIRQRRSVQDRFFFKIGSSLAVLC